MGMEADRIEEQSKLTILLALRLGFIALLLILSFKIVAPFLMLGTLGATVSITYPISISLPVFPEVSAALIMSVPESSTEIVQFTTVTPD